MANIFPTKGFPSAQGVAHPAQVPINPILFQTLVAMPIALPPIKVPKKAAKITVNKPLTAIKRKRKIELALCPKCGSPNLFAFSDLKNKMYDKNAVITITAVCTNCHWEEKTPSCNILPLYEADFKNALAKYYQTVKSPNEAILTFKFFKFEKSPWQLKHTAEGGGCDIHAFCQDTNGVMYRFGNESAKKILYFAVKERQFKCVIAYQKHWKKQQNSHGSIPDGTTLHFRQSPKVIGGIELLP